MRKERAKISDLFTLFLFLLLLGEFCRWELADALHTGIFACLGADSGREQDRGCAGHQGSCGSCPQLSASSYGAYRFQDSVLSCF